MSHVVTISKVKIFDIPLFQKLLRENKTLTIKDTPIVSSLGKNSAGVTRLSISMDKESALKGNRLLLYRPWVEVDQDGTLRMDDWDQHKIMPTVDQYIMEKARQEVQAKGYTCGNITVLTDGTLELEAVKSDTADDGTHYVEKSY